MTTKQQIIEKYSQDCLYLKNGKEATILLADFLTEIESIKQDKPHGVFGYGKVIREDDKPICEHSEDKLSMSYIKLSEVEKKLLCNKGSLIGTDAKNQKKNLCEYVERLINQYASLSLIANGSVNNHIGESNEMINKHLNTLVVPEKIDISKYFLQLNSRANKMSMPDYEYQTKLIETISKTIGSFEFKINEIINYLENIQK